MLAINSPTRIFLGFLSLAFPILVGTPQLALSSPSRIVTLAPSLGELAADLLRGEMNRIVGVSERSDYPPSLKKKVSVGPYPQINLERVLSLKPDLVLATSDGNSKEQISHLRELHIPVLVVSTSNFREIADSMVKLGEAVGYPERGKQMASQFIQGIENFKKRAKSRIEKKLPVKRVLLQIGDEPVVTVGSRSFLSEALESIGAESIYADAPQPYPRPSLEDILKRNPDMILILDLGGPEERDKQGGRASRFEAELRRWQSFPQLKAVQSNSVKILHNDALLRPSLRLLEGLSLLENSIYGTQ